MTGLNTPGAAGFYAYFREPRRRAESGASSRFPETIFGSVAVFAYIEADGY